jgi:3-dehydroquinate dehydratase type I
MTQICVALVEETTAGMVARMAELAPVADLFEIRADRVIDLDLLTILRARTRPLVLTCRPVSQGGSWDDADPRRRMTLLEGVKRRFDYVDIELRSGFMDVMVEKVGEGLIVSHHDLEGVPLDLDGLYKEMTDVGADIAKIVATPQSIGR